MSELYAICWGSGSCDDHGNAHAYSGVEALYTSKEKALEALVAYKDQTLEEIKDDLDPDEEYPDLVEDADIQVYGSVEEEYFEIDYTIGDEPCEVYIRVVGSPVIE